MIETFYVHIEFATKKPWSVNLPFLCNKCGVCCTLDDFLCAGKITLQPDDHVEVQAKLKALFDELGKMWEADEEKYDQYIQQTPCPFKVNNTCSIYEIRPQGCRMYPKTAFGMQTNDCLSLDQFKKQRAALVKGRRHKETYHYTWQEPMKRTRFTEKQYRTCLAKLHAAGATEDEVTLFKGFNQTK
jgi:Fe-S-cluster containining protein